MILNKLKYNKNNGFILLEIILVLGLVGLASAAIYGNYNNKREDKTVDRQLILLEDITKRTVSAFSTSQNPATNATTENLMAMKAVPVELRDEVNGKVINLFGGSIFVSGINPAVDPLVTPPASEADAGAIRITLDKISSNACSKLALSPYGNKAYGLSINGTQIRPDGTPPTTDQVIEVTNNCSLSSENQISYTYSFYQPDLIPRIIGNGAIRNKETPENIADIGSSTITPAACVGGSTWSPESSSCFCPATSQWDGSECVPFESDVGNCYPGTGWNGNACVPHPKVGKVESYVAIRNNDFDMPVGSDVQNPRVIQEYGRRIPNVGYPEAILSNTQITSTGTVPFTKEVCIEDQVHPVTGVPLTTTKPGEDSGYHCSVCSDGSTWNPIFKRCVKN